MASLGKKISKHASQTSSLRPSLTTEAPLWPALSSTPAWSSTQQPWQQTSEMLKWFPSVSKSEQRCNTGKYLSSSCSRHATPKLLVWSTSANSTRVSTPWWPLRRHSLKNYSTLWTLTRLAWLITRNFSEYSKRRPPRRFPELARLFKIASTGRRTSSLASRPGSGAPSSTPLRPSDRLIWTSTGSSRGRTWGALSKSTSWSGRRRS